MTPRHRSQGRGERRVQPLSVYSITRWPTEFRVTCLHRNEETCRMWNAITAPQLFRRTYSLWTLAICYRLTRYFHTNSNGETFAGIFINCTVTRVPLEETTCQVENMNSWIYRQRTFLGTYLPHTLHPLHNLIECNNQKISRPLPVGGI